MRLNLLKIAHGFFATSLLNTGSNRPSLCIHLLTSALLSMLTMSRISWIFSQWGDFFHFQVYVPIKKASNSFGIFSFLFIGLISALLEHQINLFKEVWLTEVACES